MVIGFNFYNDNYKLIEGQTCEFSDDKLKKSGKDSERDQKNKTKGKDKKSSKTIGLIKDIVNN